MTIADLQKAKWKPLTYGVEYISSIDNVNPQATSLIYFTPIAIQKDGRIIQVLKNSRTPEQTSLIELALTDSLVVLLKGSTEGYLKINVIKHLLGRRFSASIYLTEDYESKHFSTVDSLQLLSIPGIKSAFFSSKEDAKRKFTDNHETWDNVLSENPLPMVIEITLDSNSFSEQAMETIKSAVMQKIKKITDFGYPKTFLTQMNSYLYLEYGRNE